MNDSYICTTGGEINAGRYRYPAWRRAMTAETVDEIGSNTWGSLDPKNNAALNPNYPSNPEWYGNGFTAKAVAWCGGVWDDDTGTWYSLLAGGHSDHAGNDPYKLCLLDETPTWAMLRAPSGAIGNLLTTNDGQESSGVYSDGRPRSTHTYNKELYIPGVGPIMVVQGRCAWSANGGTSNTLLMDAMTGEFSVVAICPDSWMNTSGAASAWDSTRGLVWYRSATGGRLMSLDPDTWTWSTHPTWSYDGLSGYKKLVYASEIDRVIQIDDGGAIRVCNVDDGTMTTPTITGSAPSGFVGLSGIVGADWNGESLAIWHNSSSTGVIGMLTPTGDPDNDAWLWGSETYTGTVPGACLTNGTYGRFGYSRRLDGYYLQNAVTEKMRFFARG